MGQVSASETRKLIEKAICAEPLSVEFFLASPAMEKQVAAVESEAQLVVPTGATGTVSKAMSD